MRSPFRAILFSLNVLVFALLVTVGAPAVITPAAASPLPLASSTDYMARSHRNTTSSVLVKHVQPEDSLSRRKDLSADTVEDIRSRDINTVLGDINVLNNYYTQMSTHASNFRKYPKFLSSMR